MALFKILIEHISTLLYCISYNNIDLLINNNNTWYKYI